MLISNLCSDVVSPAAYILFFSAVEDRNFLHPLGW